MSKKNRNRFCLRMNECDPVQAEASKILNMKGHGISEFVARAVVVFSGKSVDDLYFSSIAAAKESGREKSPESKKGPPKIDAGSEAKQGNPMRAMLDGLGKFKEV